MVLDISSRKIVAWSVDTIESDKAAKRLIDRACTRDGIDAEALSLHSDRGAQMTSTTMAELLEDLGVTRSLARPRTSNDNPYSEANFKTAKPLSVSDGGHRRGVGSWWLEPASIR